MSGGAHGWLAYAKFFRNRSIGFFGVRFDCFFGAMCFRHIRDAAIAVRVCLGTAPGANHALYGHFDNDGAH
jgi:hypothetical protein